MAIARRDPFYSTSPFGTAADRWFWPSYTAAGPSNGATAPVDVYTEGDWVAAELFVEAIRKIGTNPVNRKSLVDALNSITNFDTKGLTKPLSYSAGNSHDPNKCFQWIQKRSGIWTTHSGWNCF